MIFLFRKLFRKSDAESKQNSDFFEISVSFRTQPYLWSWWGRCRRYNKCGIECTDNTFIDHWVELIDLLELTQQGASGILLCGWVFSGIPILLCWWVSDDVCASCESGSLKSTESAPIGLSSIALPLMSRNKYSPLVLYTRIFWLLKKAYCCVVHKEVESF